MESIASVMLCAMNRSNNHSSKPLKTFTRVTVYNSAITFFVRNNARVLKRMANLIFATLLKEKTNVIDISEERHLSVVDV